VYNAERAGDPLKASAKEKIMGTCPKCKLRIRRNGNHVKLGSTWVHKMCPRKAARSTKPA
jgi:hypothetical protein